MKGNRCPRRSFVSDERAVADVVGSILLVSITVASAGALSLLVLSIPGPLGTIHVSLDATIGPGADLDWGPNDAELRLRHLGGEPLRAEDTVVRLRFENGTVLQIVPDFADGVFHIGQQWTRTISAEEDDRVAIQVIGTSGSTTQLLFEAGNVALATSAFAVTYATDYTIRAGTVANFAGAQSANDGDNAAVIGEGSAGGGPGGTTTLDGSFAFGSGATSPENARFSDDGHALLALVGTSASVGGFVAPSGATSLNPVTIGLEAYSPVTVSPVEFGDSVTATERDSDVISAPWVAPPTGHVFLATISNTDGQERVLDVNGLGLAWSYVAGDCDGERNGVCLEVWAGVGNAATGQVTASYAGSVSRSALAVASYSGVDPNNPITSSIFTQYPGSGSASWSTPAIDGLSNGRLVVAVGSDTREPTAWDGDLVVRESFRRPWLSMADEPVDGTNAASGDLESSADWQAVALTLRPVVPPAPTLTLGYELSGTPGTISRTVTLTGTEQAYTLDVSAARNWSAADISNLVVTATVAQAADGGVFLDHLFTRVTAAGSGAFETDVEIEFDGLPSSGTHQLDLRYKTAAPGDTFRVEVQNGTGWRPCAGALASVALNSFSCTLLQDEVAAQTATIRIVDTDPLSGIPGTLEIEYARINTL